MAINRGEGNSSSSEYWGCHGVTRSEWNVSMGPPQSKGLFHAHKTPVSRPGPGPVPPATPRHCTRSTPPPRRLLSRQPGGSEPHGCPPYGCPPPNAGLGPVRFRRFAGRGTSRQVVLRRPGVQHRQPASGPGGLALQGVLGTASPSVGGVGCLEPSVVWVALRSDDESDEMS